jgi:hypothetical protein
MPISESPPLYKHTLSNELVSESLSDRRSAVMKDLGQWIPEVSLDDFCKCLLPENVAKPTQSLSQLKKNHIKHNRWSSFLVDPEKSKETEMASFGYLKDVVAAITQSSVTHGVTERPFVQSPSKSATGEIANKTRPDGYFLADRDVKVKEGKHQWCDICIPHEYTKSASSKDVQDASSHHFYPVHFLVYL